MSRGRLNPWAWAAKNSRLLRAECPSCGEIRHVDEDGACAGCGLDVSLVYQCGRIYLGDRIGRADWKEICREAKESV